MSKKKLNSPLLRHAEFTQESPPTTLCKAIGYFGPSLPKAFVVTEGGYSPRGSEGMAEGDVFVVYLHKREVTLKVESSPGNDPVTVSGTSFTEFALTPPNEDVTETDIANWEGLYSSVTNFLEATKRNRWPMPAALKVLDNAVDHNRQFVPAQTLLFNIQEVSLLQRVGLRKKMKSGIEGVDCSGTVHQFLESEDPLYFSTNLYDVKCIPLYFTEVVQFSQPARVYRHPNTEEGEEEDALENLSTITIAEVTRGNRLVVRKLHTRDQLGPNFTVPLNANLKVAAIRLHQGHLLDRVSDQRCMKKSMSCPNLARIATHGDIYMNAHFEDYCEMARGDVQAGEKRDHNMEACYSVDTLKLKKHRRCGNVAGAVDIPGTSDRLHVMTTDTDSDADSDREYMEDRMLTGVHQGRKVPLSCPGSLLQGLSLSWKKRKYSARDEASLGYSPLAQARKEDGHFLPCPQNTEKYEEIEEDAFTQQRPMKSDYKLPQPQPSRPSPPVSPACSDLSTKTKPKGVPSTAIPLVPAVSPRTRNPPPVPKKPIMLTSSPKEPELYFHVAAKLGLDWRKVCTYLGLQHYQLDQAHVAQNQLEDKAMEALVMWLQGQGESRAPRSWSTLLRALRRAGHIDMANHVEKCIGDGTLELS